MAKFDESKLNKQEPIRKSKSFKRTLVKEKGIVSIDAVAGRIVTVVGKNVEVEYLNVDGSRQIVECGVAGSVVSKNRHSALIAAGDEVKIVLEEQGLSDKKYGTIVEIMERKTKLSRVDPANTNREQVICSNVEWVMIFMSSFDPAVNPRLIDRILVAASLGKLKPVICINKMDLADFDVFKECFAVYESLDVPVFFTSIVENKGVQKVIDFLKDKETALVGVSGSGKSSLLNAILGEKVQRVGEISEVMSKGRHTTSAAKIFDLPFGGKLVDTPGIREFGVWDLKKDELALFYPDFFDYFRDCKYNPCTHTHEPGCAVKIAVESGDIDEERFESYKNIMESLEE